MKTALAPAEAAIRPAAAGTMNCPKRFPVNRVDTAKALSSGTVS